MVSELILTFNRTTVECKVSISSIAVFSIITFNRTTVECKAPKLIASTGSQVTFNRTTVECKGYSRGGWYLCIAF